MEHFGIYLSALIAGLLGILISIIVKGNSLKAKAKAGNATFTWLGYVKDDFGAILLSFVVLITCVYLLGDKGIQNYEDYYANWSRAVFVFVGYAGSDAAIRILGRTSNKINNVIDVKTNIADSKTTE